MTDKATLLQIDIEIALRGPIDVGDYVAIAFSSKEPPNTPSGSESDALYFPLPGQTVDTSLLTHSIDTYYDTYFANWSDYILCQVGGPSFYASGGTGFQITTTDNTSIAPKTTFQVTHNFQSSTSTLKLSFFVGEIASATTGSTLYLTLLTTRHDPTKSDLSQGNSGYFKDVLLSPIAIPLRAGQSLQKLPNQEGTDETLPSASDIQAWRVSIF